MLINVKNEVVHVAGRGKNPEIVCLTSHVVVLREERTLIGWL